jgi:hypothetical protein
MADTYPKLPLALAIPNNSFLSYAVRTLEEGATQTFVKDAPVVVTAGLVVEAANPVTAVFGFAVRAGQNVAAAAALAEYVPAFPGLEIYGNLLDDTDPVANDHTFARADVGNDFPLEKAAFLAGGGTAWYFNDDSDGTPPEGVRVVNTKSDFTHTEASGTGGRERPAVGDLNPRLTAVVLAAVIAYD